MGSQAVRKIPACLLLAATLLTVSPILASAQEHYLVFFPSTITAGQYSGDVDIFAALVGDDASLAWPAEQPREIAAQSYREFDPVAVPDGEDGAFVIYTIEHTDTLHTGDRDVLMRRVNRLGDNVLGGPSSSVVAIARSPNLEFDPIAVATADGSVIVFYHVVTTGGPTPTAPPQTGTDVQAIKVDRAGVPLWDGPVWVMRTRAEDRIVGAVADQRGGAIAVLERRGVIDALETGDIAAIHVDSYGKTGWGASSDPVLVGASRHDELNAASVSDGRGGVYIAYEIKYTSGPRAGDHDILAQHVTATGQREWVSETALPIVSSVPTANETRPSIALDTAGIIVAFEMDFHSEKRPVKLIGVQRMDNTGRLAWNNGRKPEVVGALGRVNLRPRLTGEFYGGAFVTFEAIDTATGDVDVYAQKFNSGGSQLWSNGGSPLPLFRSPDRERDVAAIADGTGGLIAVASKEFIADDGTSARKIVAQRITGDARNPWSQIAGPLLLSNTNTIDGKPVIVRAGGTR